MIIIKKQYPVIGMSCASCASRIESALNKFPGVEKAAVNLASQTALIEYQPAVVRPEELKKTIQSIGYDLIVDTSEEAMNEAEDLQQRRYLEQSRRTIGAIILSIPLVIIAMFFMSMPYASYIQWIIATPVVLWFGRDFFIRAWKQLRHQSANMDTLVALSTGIAYVFSVINTLFPELWSNRGLHAHVYFEASGVVIAFVLLGKLLEEKAKSKTSYSIKKLMGLQPNVAHIIRTGGEVVDIPVSMVKTDDKLLVKPGEKIPVDGTVFSGNSYVNESMISGEPMPVFKDERSKVFAGTINQNGSFQLTAEKVGNETFLSSIIRLVQQAQGSKAPVQKLVDKVAAIFVPVVIVISILTLILWIVLGGENGLAQGILSMVTVLVIACPCALGLATPTAIMVGIGKGAENNILIKDAEALELSCKINSIVLDKTGTITEGKPEMEKIEWAEEEGSKEYRDILFSLEKASEHPLAVAVANYLKSISASVDLTDIENFPGKGIGGIYNGERYFAGSYNLMKEHKIILNNNLDMLSLKWEEQSKSVIYFSDSKRQLAIMCVTDRIKDNVYEVIHEIKKSGIEVHMLTGDNYKTAEVVAKKTGIELFKAGMLPSEKASYIKTLQHQGKITAMVGDGINDSHALATSDVGIAMGRGSDIAIETARLTIIGDNLNSILTAIRLSKRTVKTIRQNLFWAFIYNIIGIPIAAGVLFPAYGFLLNPMIAGAAMALSSISVVSNSLRLKWTN